MASVQPSYRVVFWGGLMLGQERLQVAKRFARQFKIRQPRQLQQLFSGRLLTLKGALQYDQAKRYSDAIRAMGAICRIELETNLLAAQYQEQQKQALETFKPLAAEPLQVLTTEDLSRDVNDEIDNKDPFAAREPMTEQHPPCKYFDARASSSAIKQAQKRL